MDHSGVTTISSPHTSTPPLTLPHQPPQFLDFYSSKIARLVEAAAKAVQGLELPTLTAEYVGIDTSLNPSLDPDGSIGLALESLPFVPSGIGGCGVIAAAAAVTTAIQSLPFLRTGYCGIMLPVCEDQRLSAIQVRSGAARSEATNAQCYLST